jgi:hypothetical protein
LTTYVVGAIKVGMSSPPTDTLPCPAPTPGHLDPIALEGLRAKLDRIAGTLAEVAPGQLCEVCIGLNLIPLAEQLAALGGKARTYPFTNGHQVTRTEYFVGRTEFYTSYTHSVSALDADAAALGDA